MAEETGKRDEIEKANVIETYSIVSENVGIEIDIIDDEKYFVRRYFLNFPSYGPGTMALLNNLRGNILSETSMRAEKQVEAKFVELTKRRFRDRALKLMERGLPGLPEDTKDLLIAVLLNEMLGLGKIEFLLNDPNLEEIVVNSSKDPVWVYHKKYGWLITNVEMKSEDEIENYSSIIARRIGKQITILNPLLDAHLVTGDRANATLFPISSAGNTITIRKFRREPWTVTDFVSNKTANKDVMALIWMVMEFEMNMIVSGGTGSGKTSFLNVCMPFIQPNHRILTIEDSVAGESEMLYEFKGRVNKATIGELVDGIVEDDSIQDASIENEYGIRVLSMDAFGKVEWTEPSLFIRHSVEKDMLEITLESGRRIRVTEDHSLFGLAEDGSIGAVPGKALKKGGFIAVPREIAWQGQKVRFDFRQHLKEFDRCFVKSLEVKPLVKKHYKTLNEDYNKSSLQGVMRKSIASTALMQMIPESVETGFICSRLGTKIPLELEIDEALACFAGLWLADGCYDQNSVLVSVVEPECRAIVEKTAKRFNANVKMHSDGFTLMVNSKPFRLMLERPLGFKGDSFTKRVPEWAFGLEKREAAAMIKGYFSGDGWVRKYDIAVRSCSEQLLKDMQTMLLRFGIPLRVKWKRLKDKAFEARISGQKFVKLFQEQIGFLQKEKREKLEIIVQRKSHDVSDVVPLPKQFYKAIKEELRAEIGKTITYKSWKSFLGRHKSNMGRETLRGYVERFEKLQKTSLAWLAFNDLQWDRIEQIKKRSFKGFVYDLCVPENESFVCENIVAHNTRELMLPPFLHWVPLTTREPNPEGKGGVRMLDLLVNSLRMRPDRIIVGEIRRQREAEVMFEAMHTGHSVYTTFHANTSEETVRRFINPPVNVPSTLLEAVHLNIVMFRNRRLGVRRILQASEFIPERRGSKESIKVNVLYRWRGSDDQIVPHGESIRLYDELSLHTGFSRGEIMDELSKKRDVLDWLIKFNVRDVKDVGGVMAHYYREPEEVMEAVKKNQKPELETEKMKKGQGK